jgi:hypothetical protein
MNFTHDNSKLGFVYLFECFNRKTGETVWAHREENVIPNEGRDYILNAALNAGSQFDDWFIGLYSGNYPPVVGDTAATFPASATEITTAYDEATRQPLVPGALSSGLYANTSSPAIFTFNATTIVRGGFISSAATKGGTTGVLLSAVLSTTPKTVGDTEALRVYAGLSLTTI